jgi:hypothetical protein
MHIYMYIYIMMLALIALASDLRVFVKRACRHPRHPDGDLRQHLLAPPLGFRTMKMLLKAKDFINYSYQNNVDVLKSQQIFSTAVVKGGSDDGSGGGGRNDKDENGKNGKKKDNKNKSKNKSKSKSDDKAFSSSSGSESKSAREGKGLPFKYNIDKDHDRLSDEKNIHATFTALMNDIKQNEKTAAVTAGQGRKQQYNSSNDDGSSSSSGIASTTTTTTTTSDALLSLPWVSDYIEKVFIARGVYKAMCIKNKLLQLSAAFKYVAEVASYCLKLIQEQQTLFIDYSLSNEVSSKRKNKVKGKDGSSSSTSSGNISNNNNSQQQQGEEEDDDDDDGDVWFGAKGMKWRQQRDNHLVVLKPLVEVGEDLSFWCLESAQVKTTTSNSCTTGTTSSTPFLFKAGDVDRKTLLLS